MVSVTMMGALGGIALVLGLLQLLEYHERTAAAKPVSSLLRYIGKNSFIFYSLNQVGLLIGEEILGACGIPLNNITWPWQLLWGGACIVIAVLLCVPMVEFTNRCFPQILGKPRRISAHLERTLDMPTRSVALITYHAAHNNGSFLQAYATQRKIQQLGYDCDIINFSTPRQQYLV